jgi:hypothetical protein
MPSTATEHTELCAEKEPGLPSNVVTVPPPGKTCLVGGQDFPAAEQNTRLQQHLETLWKCSGNDAPESHENFRRNRNGTPNARAFVSSTTSA